MNAPKNSPEILALSVVAQAILAGHWMMGKNCTLTLQNQTSRLTADGKVAMQELIDADIINEGNSDDGYAEGRCYTMSDKGAEFEFRKSLNWMAEHGKFSITEPVA